MPLPALTGRSEHQLDNKGRFVLNARWRQGLDRSVVMVMGDDGCVAIFPPDTWAPYATEILGRRGDAQKNRDLKRLILSETYEVDLDSSGRLAIPPGLREDAGISSAGDNPRGARVVVVGVGDHLECWSPGRWREVQEREAAGPPISRGF